MNTLVEFKSLSKSFNNKFLLDNISFKLNKGEITTLIGQNGAGKTTIAKIILKLESYDTGTLVVRNKLRIGYVPQKLDFGFSMPITVKKLIKMFNPSMDILDSNDDIALKLFEFSNYNKIKNKDISQLSGGEMQKLLLVATILNKPELLILDEPTQFLDVTSQQTFYHLLSELKRELGLTIFMISHDLFTVMKNSDQVICLNAHVCCIGKPTELNTNIDFKNALSEIGVYIHSHDHKH